MVAHGGDLIISHQGQSRDRPVAVEPTAIRPVTAVEYAFESRPPRHNCLEPRGISELTLLMPMAPNSDGGHPAASQQYHGG